MRRLIMRLLCPMKCSSLKPQKQRSLREKERALALVKRRKTNLNGHLAVGRMTSFLIKSRLLSVRPTF